MLFKRLFLIFSFMILPCFAFSQGISPVLLPSEGGSAVVANNTALKALLPSNYPYAIRLGYATIGDGGYAVYSLTSSACSLNSGSGDNGYQVSLTSGGCALLGSPAPYNPMIWGETTAQMYVATAGNGGSDTNNFCFSNTAPCLTVQHALNNLVNVYLNANWPIINIGTGTFSSPVQLSGALYGGAGSNSSGTYIVLNGNGIANTTLTASTGQMALELSQHAGLLIQNMNVTAPQGGYAAFIQEYATLQIGQNTQCTGGGNTSVCWHSEGHGLIEVSSVNNNVKLTGSFGYFMTVGSDLGAIELDPGSAGTHGTFTCVSTPTFANQFAFVADNSQLLVGSYWNSSGCSGGGSTGQYFGIVGNGIINELTTDFVFPGSIQGFVSTGGRIEGGVTSLLASVAAFAGNGSGANGIGTGGTVTLAAYSTPRAGQLIITTGTGTMPTYVSVNINFPYKIQNYIGSQGSCTANLDLSGASWAAGAYVPQKYVPGSPDQLILQPFNNTTYTASSAYYVDYTCPGD